MSSYLFSDFCFGFFQGSIATIIAPVQESIEPYFIVLFPLLAGLIQAGAGLDYYVPALPFLDILFGSISVFLFTRFVMMASRALIAKHEFESEKYKSVILIVSFVSAVIAGYAGYTYFDPLYCKNETYYAWCATQIGALIFTLVIPNGVISDFFCCFAYSTVFMLKTPEDSPPRDILTVMRLLFATLSALTPLVEFELPEELHRVFLMDLDLGKRPVQWTMVLASYFFASSTSVFVPGSYKSLLHGCLSPELYVCLVVYEFLVTAD